MHVECNELTFHYVTLRTNKAALRQPREARMETATRKYLADERSKKSPWKERALRLEESINQCRGIGKRDAGETFVCADGGRALEIANMHSAGNWRIAGFGVAVSATRDKGGKFRVKS